MDIKLSKSRVKNFSKDLIKWYEVNKRELPWRKTKDPYKIWLSEIILQQTKIAQGLPYYLRFINKYPNVFKLANSSEQEVLKLWEGLGYYSRARNLHKTANIIVNKQQGVFPSKYKELIELPGIGDYTASAISSFSINEINPVVDGNVYRFLSRLIGIKSPINTSKSQKEFKDIAELLISKKNPSDFNQAIMEFGALVCKPSSPFCEKCLYQKNCFAYLNKQISNLPVKNKKKKNINRYFNFLIIKSKKNQTVIEKRINQDIWQNLYQFPLIETGSQVDKKIILDRLIKINYFDSSEMELFLFKNKSFRHKLSHQNIHCSFWIIKVKKIKTDFVNILNLDLYPFPKPISNFLSIYNW